MYTTTGCAQLSSCRQVQGGTDLNSISVSTTSDTTRPKFFQLFSADSDCICSLDPTRTVVQFTCLLISVWRAKSLFQVQAKQVEYASRINRWRSLVNTRAVVVSAARYAQAPNPNFKLIHGSDDEYKQMMNTSRVWNWCWIGLVSQETLESDTCLASLQLFCYHILPAEFESEKQTKLCHSFSKDQLCYCY